MSDLGILAQRGRVFGVPASFAARIGLLSPGGRGPS
jgi:hypothetical protein